MSIVGDGKDYNMNCKLSPLDGRLCDGSAQAPALVGL